MPNAIASAPIPGTGRANEAVTKTAPATGQLPLGMPEPAEPADTSVRQAVAAALRTPAALPTPAASDSKPADSNNS
ncbi:MAG: hypothetical protein JNN30_09200 [Rhodanobacteraceae bacterium]|nr:hypothetical protein [Rhodanobacteraceae bacterium]